MNYTELLIAPATANKCFANIFCEIGNFFIIILERLRLH